MKGDKRGAIELSIGTIVIIVLAMSMLILGMVLVKNIFSGSTQNVLSMNDKVRDQIGALFTEDRPVVVNLPNKIAKISQNENWGISFGIQNLGKGTSEIGQFSYAVTVSDPNVRTKCGIDERTIESWMIAGQSDNIPIAPGKAFEGIVRFMIPDSSPLCIVRFHLDVKKDNVLYATDFFDVEVIA